MPSRSAKLIRSLVPIAAVCVAIVSVGQELTLPDSTTGGSIADTIAPPSLSGSGTRSLVTDSPSMGVAPMSPDATLLEGPPASAFSSGQVYNPTLGAHLRARYNTRSYGQQEGTLDIGTMKLMEVDGGVAFLDGQVTMNDDSGVGYNLGLGYRWLTLPMFPFSPDDQKIMGRERLVGRPDDRPGELLQSGRRVVRVAGRASRLPGERLRTGRTAHADA